MWDRALKCLQKFSFLSSYCQVIILEELMCLLSILCYMSGQIWKIEKELFYLKAKVRQCFSCHLLIISRSHLGDWILCMLRKSIPYFGSVRSWRKSSSVRDVQWKVRVDLFNKRRKLGLAWTRLSNQLHSMGLEAQQLPQPCLQLIRASKNQKWHLLVATCPGKLQVLLEAFSNKNWEQKRSTQNQTNWVKASVLGH